MILEILSKEVDDKSKNFLLEKSKCSNGMDWKIKDFEMFQKEQFKQEDQIVESDEDDNDPIQTKV